MKNILLIVSFFGCSSIYTSEDKKVQRVLFPQEASAEVKTTEKVDKKEVLTGIIVGGKYEYLAEEKTGSLIVLMEKRNLNPNQKADR